jgi:hypothetical protein
MRDWRLALGFTLGMAVTLLILPDSIFAVMSKDRSVRFLICTTSAMEAGQYARPHAPHTLTASSEKRVGP